MKTFRILVLSLVVVFGVTLTAYAQFVSRYSYNTFPILPSTRADQLYTGDYRGYSICLFNFGGEHGYIAAGTRSSNAVHDSINIIEIPMWDGIPGLTPGSPALAQAPQPSNIHGFNFGLPGFQDIRVVGLTEVNSGVGSYNLAVLVQARSGGMTDQAAIVLLDCNSFGTPPSIVRVIYLRAPNGGLYPQAIACPYVFSVPHSTYNNTLYVGGFATQGPIMYPQEPSLTTDKQAFLCKVDLTNGTTNTMFFNTDQDMTPAPAPGLPGVNDYDAVLRLRYIHGSWLLLTGSANTSSYTAWPGDPTHPVNTSASWVAEIDTATMTVAGQDFLGTSNVDAGILPTSKAGFDAVDINMHFYGPHDYYLLQNRLDHNGWYLSHIDHSTVTLSAPLSGHNSFYFADSSVSQKALVYNGHGWGDWTGAGNRAGIYGAFGGIHFSAGFEAQYLPSTGTAINCCVLPYQNQPGSSYTLHISSNPPSSIVTDEPYFLSSDLRIWSNPDCAVRWLRGNSSSIGVPAVPTGSTTTPDDDDWAMMSHFERSPISVAPRFMQGDLDGAGAGIVSCTSFHSEPILFSNIQPTSVISKDVLQGISSPSLFVDDQNYATSASIVNNMIFDCMASYNGSSWGFYKQAGPLKSSPSVSLSPNPATNEIVATFDTNLDPATDRVRLVVTDLTGRTVLDQTAADIDRNKVRFRLSDIAPGVYYARCGNNGVMTSAKILTIIR